MSLVLIVGIVILLVDVIIPKYTPRTPARIIKEIDFSNSSWIETYTDKSYGLFGKDFFLATAFTYNVRSSKMVVTYASQNSVEEIREYYLSLPGAQLTGRNDETSLDVLVEADGQALRAYNYYSAVSRVIELELTLPPDRAQQVIAQLEAAFPAGQVAAIAELQDLAAGDTFGGYVRYRYDRLDEFSYPYTPIFSRAYYYSGGEEDFLASVGELMAAYPDSKYDQTQDTYHFKINGQLVSLGYFVTDTDGGVVTISLQQEPLQN